MFLHEVIDYRWLPNPPSHHIFPNEQTAWQWMTNKPRCQYIYRDWHPSILAECVNNGTVKFEWDHSWLPGYDPISSGMRYGT